MNSLVGAADLSIRIQKCSKHAFELILQRFPHYKACYRIARMHFDERNYAQCADILFEKLFLTNRKQRCNNFLEVLLKNFIEKIDKLLECYRDKAVWFWTEWFIPLPSLQNR